MNIKEARCTPLSAQAPSTVNSSEAANFSHAVYAFDYGIDLRVSAFMTAMLYFWMYAENMKDLSKYVAKYILRVLGSI